MTTEEPDGTLMEHTKRLQTSFALGARGVLDYNSRIMRLITAHKILIISATIFFIFFALWELNRYSNSDDVWTMARGILYFLVALGFGIYLKNFNRRYK